VESSAKIKDQKKRIRRPKSNNTRKPSLKKKNIRPNSLKTRKERKSLCLKSLRNHSKPKSTKYSTFDNRKRNLKDLVNMNIKNMKDRKLN